MSLDSHRISVEMILHRPTRDRAGAVGANLNHQSSHDRRLFRERIFAVDDLRRKWRVVLWFTHGSSLSGVGGGAKRGSPTP
jgi:hypothetical protein